MTGGSNIPAAAAMMPNQTPASSRISSQVRLCLFRTPDTNPRRMHTYLSQVHCIAKELSLIFSDSSAFASMQSKLCLG